MSILIPRQPCLRKLTTSFKYLPRAQIARISQGSGKQDEKQELADDPRIEESGDLTIEDQYAMIRDNYGEIGLYPYP